MSSSPSARPSAAPAATHRFRINGLDALRAVAVLAVLVYHVDPGLLPGGFMGVDVFFVVSGFLITTLLLRERARTGRIDLRGFWVRRARRLLPALVLVVLVCTALSLLGSPDLRVGIGRQILGAATFSTNWLELAFGGSYFHHTSPILFMNFWSLAVEEQFYLVWPPLFLLLMALVRSPMARAGIALGAAVVSAVLMAGLYVPGQDATRVYYGTDTHSFGLLLGIALAFAWSTGSTATGSAATRRAGLGRPSAGDEPAVVWLAGKAPGRAAFGIGVVFLLLAFTLFSEGAAETYRGGLLLASAGSLLLIASQVSGGRPPHPVLGRALEAAPLVWVGRRSYGIYLWHWPVLKILNDLLPADARTPAWWAVQGAAVVVTALAASLSEKYVEQPVRRLGFRESGRRMLAVLRLVPAPDSARRGRPAATALVLGLTGLLVVGSAGAAVLTAPEKSRVEQEIEDSQQAMEQSRRQAKERAEQRASASPEASGSPSDSPDHTAGPGGAQPRPGTFPAPAPEDVTLIGDSMIAVSVDGILATFPGALVDGVPNRKWDEAQGIVAGHLADRTLSRYVVVDFGTNGGIPDAGVLDRVLDQLGPDRAVVLVTIYGQSTFIDPANQLLRDAAARRPNVRVADWNAIAAAHPEYLQSDRTHPNVPGATVFAELLRNTFREFSGTPAPSR